MAGSKILFLLRHGQAEPGIGPIGDLKRPLSEAGKSQLNQLSFLLEARKTSFDLTLVSPSTRTLQTSEIISKTVFSKEVLEIEEIYEAEIIELLGILNKTDTRVNNLLIIGHNPSLSLLACYLTGEDFINLDPGMMAIIEIGLFDWNEIGKGCGMLNEVLM